MALALLRMRGWMWIAYGCRALGCHATAWRLLERVERQVGEYQRWRVWG